MSEIFAYCPCSTLLDLPTFRSPTLHRNRPWNVCCLNVALLQLVAVLEWIIWGPNWGQPNVLTPSIWLGLIFKKSWPLTPLPYSQYNRLLTALIPVKILLPGKLITNMPALRTSTHVTSYHTNTLVENIFSDLQNRFAPILLNSRAGYCFGRAVRFLQIPRSCYRRPIENKSG